MVIPNLYDILVFIEGRNQPLITLVVGFSIDDILNVMMNIEGDLSEKIFLEDYKVKSCDADEDGPLETMYRLLALLNQPEHVTCRKSAQQKSCWF